MLPTLPLRLSPERVDERKHDSPPFSAEELKAMMACEKVLVKSMNWKSATVEHQL
jgi:hypothetical protein